RSRVCLTRQSRHHAPGRPFSTSRTDNIIGQYIIIGRAVLDEGPITDFKPFVSGDPRTLAPFLRSIRRRSEKHGVELAPAGHAHGIQGSTTSRAPRSRNPRIDSSPARYIHAADPVYHVQPPRPTCGGTA